MPRLLQRLQRGAFSLQEIAEIEEQTEPALDALVYDGRDPSAAHRAYVRALNDARQRTEAAQGTGHERRSVAAQAAWNRVTREQRAAHAHGPRARSFPSEGED